MRLLRLQPAAVGSAAAALYVIITAVWLAAADHRMPDRPDVLVAAVSALWGLWTRAKVTPTARPRDAAGRPLVPAVAAPAANPAPPPPAGPAGPAPGLGDEPVS